MITQIIQDDYFSGHLGTISYLNDSSFQDIKRFNIVINAKEYSIRSSQGHRLDLIFFYCLSESFKNHSDYCEING